MSQVPAGFHDVKMSNGSTVRVADQPKPRIFGGSSSDGAPYDPESADFSRTSSFANKSFNPAGVALSKNQTAEEARDGKRFPSSAYATSRFGAADRPFQTVAFADSSRSANETGKGYLLPGAYDSGKPYDTGKKSEFQDRNALVAQKKVDPFSAPDSLTEKSFSDPAMTHVKHDPYSAANGLDVSRLNNLPNRPLTIDEVRNLINHEQVPDLSSKPEPASKPLNDPNWTPPEVAPMIDRPVTPGPTTEDKSGDLPSPGMMSQPTAAPAPIPK